ncbi:MAG: TIGR02300 family protein [Paracoccaceae bacterium]|tara:strand:+ start:202 stop:558 length:357 start_codon:yes stop_codon:yes gene_type:complete
MAKESWGKKRTCPKCDTRFYDLNKDPLICPNCEHTFSLDSIMEVFKKSPKDTPSKKSPAEKSTPNVEGIEPEDIILDEDLEEEANSNVDLEDDLLEEEEDDTSPIGEIQDVAKEDDES